MRFFPEKVRPFVRRQRQSEGRVLLHPVEGRQGQGEDRPGNGFAENEARRSRQELKRLLKNRSWLFSSKKTLQANGVLFLLV